MDETIQPSLYDPSRPAITLANGRQYELATGETIEVYHGGKWQRGLVTKNLWAEYCAVLSGGEALRLVVGLRARLPDGHPGLSWPAGDE